MSAGGEAQVVHVLLSCRNDGRCVGEIGWRESRQVPQVISSPPVTNCWMLEQVCVAKQSRYYTAVTLN